MASASLSSAGENPRAWTDFRVKMVVFPALEKLPGEVTEKLCRDYLALTDDQAKQLGPPQFEEAARTLLTIRPDSETARPTDEATIYIVLIMTTSRRLTR